MNPLTQIKNTQKATKREIEAGINDSASWHAQFKHSAYIFAGGLDYDLTEGDLLAVFSQYGEIVDLNLIRHKDTGKSKGFTFVAYEDQRSTVLAVDNLNGAKVVGRTIRVEHVDNYKKRKAEADGEDPNAVGEDDEGPASTGAADAAAGRRGESAERQDVGPGPQRRGRSPPAAARPQHPSSEPWAAAGSIFSLLEEARQLEAAKQKPHQQAGGQVKQEPESSGREPSKRRSGARGEMDQPLDRDRHRERERDREREDGRERDRDRARSGSAGPSSAPAFGPPRPPPRPAAAAAAGPRDDDAPGPGPGSSRRDRYDPSPRDRDNGRARDVREPGRHTGSEREAARGERRQGRRSASPGSRSPHRGEASGRDRRGGPDRGPGDRGDRGRDRELYAERGFEGERGARGRERSRSRERERERQHRERERGRDRDR
ncbi:hypothetical protein PLESTB_001219800 [Pleodorina starrii]|uniref:RRM domain-containing protein n=1 Tax=Pleodorina starrii TaxID=330485 RepID=A0A9W6BSR4_9CHLO|nr:hypothetical protein PLESTM_002059900 [Pleodorina starrii]GLC57393.1 hypothetical protein PLESTB_001219800 [Pleodorina starrii]